MYIYVRGADEQSCVGQVVNPDISGIGVRLSFYIQNFLLGEFPALIVSVELNTETHSTSDPGGPIVARCSRRAVDVYLHQLRVDHLRNRAGCAAAVITSPGPHCQQPSLVPATTRLSSDRTAHPSLSTGWRTLVPSSRWLHIQEASLARRNPRVHSEEREASRHLHPKFNILRLYKRFSLWR